MKFESIYKNYWDRVFRLCMGYSNDYDLAQDMTQDTFISVWKHLPKFKNESKIGTWIYKIATNTCLRQIEKERKNTVGDFPKNLSEERHDDIEPQIQLLYKYISELKEIDRLIISLELEDMKQSEIAEITGLSECNIRVRIHRIKEKLTLRFKENER